MGGKSRKTSKVSKKLIEKLLSNREEGCGKLCNKKSKRKKLGLIKE